MTWDRSFGLIVILALISTGPRASAQYQGIINSKHNLSVSGTGTIHATGEQEVCVFCHTPHGASAIQPIWNRNVPVNTYRVYSSTTLDAKPGQPTGSSKLCLSCHDGTVAIGSVLSKNMPIGMAGGITTIPPGAKGNIGTDLSDDHPISFVYDSALAAKDGKLKDPGVLPANVKLDGTKNLQCSSCHDPHNNSNGQFLVMRNENSQLCNTCHTVQNTTVVAHANCSTCHQNHSAPSGAELLAAKTPTESCTKCHNSSSTTAADVASDLAKPSVHDTKMAVNAADEVPNQSACISCHDPHTMTRASAVAAAPDVRGSLGKVAGVSSAGTVVPAAKYEYEVCFKCHGDRQPSGLSAVVTRQIVQTNARLEFDSSAVSFHPIEAAGRSTDVPSLRTQYTTSSVIYCTDCHSSDQGRVAGGTGPTGPHGSTFKPLLALRYDTKDFTQESEQAYALCYKCHDRNSILGDVSFPHKVHLVDKQTPCSACHDAHGISSAQGTIMKNARLINFDSLIVRPDATTGRLEFNQTGPRAGTCFLSCHGTTHSGTAYASNAMGAPTLRRGILRPALPPVRKGGARK
jgi:predicted CXXCH cytochrome family protein